MRRKIFLSFFLISCAISMYAQQSTFMDMVDETLKIRQKEGTEVVLQEYLSNIPTDSDILYVLLFRPRNCPRCEGTIPTFTNILKQYYPDAKTLLISTHEDLEASKTYLKKKNYTADYVIFDTENLYENIFSLNTNGLYSVYILKIDKNQGRLIVGGDPFHLDDEFIHGIHNAQEPLPYFDYNLHIIENTPSITPYSENSVLTYKNFNLVIDEEYPVSGAYETPILTENMFVYSDELGNAGYYFNVDKENELINFQGVVIADSLEKDLYIDLPQEIYEVRKKNGRIYYIAMDVKPMGEKKIGISYSLPRLFMESPTNLAYYNQPAIIVRNRDSLKKEPLVPLEFNLFTETYMYTHFQIFPLDEHRVAMGCNKLTWPMSFDPEDYQGIAEFDPFMDEYYDTECHYLAIFDNESGELIERFGESDISQRMSRTGYYYSNPIVGSYKDKIIYGNRYTGKLYLANSYTPSIVEKELSIFEIDIDKFPPLDSSSFYTFEHGKSYDKFFNRSIEQIILTENNIHCLVRRGEPRNKNMKKDEYEYICIDENSNIITQFRLEKDKNEINERILCFGLANENETIIPYYFAKKDQDAYIKYIYSEK